MDLYMHIVSQPARAVLVTAKMLDIDVNVKTVNMMAGETRTEDFLKMNPCHTIPTLDDNGFVLFESRAIMTYLVNQYKPDSTLYPQDPKQRATVDKILYFDASAVFSAIGNVLRPKFLQNQDPSPEAMECLKERLTILGQLLGDQQYFVGDSVTLADISLGTAMFIFMDEQILSLPDNLKQWYQRITKKVPLLLEANQEASDFIAKYQAENNSK